MSESSCLTRSTKYEPCGASGASPSSASVSGMAFAAAACAAVTYPAYSI
jgi:hypothetical protein